MPSTRQPIINAPAIGGMDATTPAYLLGKEKWAYQQDLRIYNSRIKQFNLFYQQGNLPAVETVYGIYSIPRGQVAECLFVAIANSFTYQLNPANPSNSLILNYI